MTIKNDPATASDWQARHECLKQEIVERAIIEYEGLGGYDPMEIARALLAVGFVRVDFEGPEVATGYYHHMQECCERHLAQSEAFIRAWATDYETGRAAQADRDQP